MFCHNVVLVHFGLRTAEIQVRFLTGCHGHWQLVHKEVTARESTKLAACSEVGQS